MKSSCPVTLGRKGDWQVSSARAGSSPPAPSTRTMARRGETTRVTERVLMCKILPCSERMGQCLGGPRSLGSDVERVERLARRHEETIALGSAEADVRAGFRKPDAPDELALGRPHRHPAVAEVATSVTRDPDIALDVAADAVGTAFDVVDHAIGENLAVGQLVVASDVEHVDVAVAPRVGVARAPARARHVQLLV